YVEPVKVEKEELQDSNRIDTLRAPAEWRKRNFAEVEVTLSINEATRESLRCLRCDLEFTQCKADETIVLEEVCNG
ncbi:MAG: Hydrogenase, partial [Bacteroidota bacterium]|nr:Hydrogenase [Bacteroidota bacterium]